MDCFIKKVFEKKIDEETHRKFVRFGRGVYGKKAMISLHKTAKVKLAGSFEFANDFVNLVSERGNFKFSGIILSREKLDLENEKKKSGIFNYEVSGLESQKIKEIKDKIYYMLLDADGADLTLKIKKKLPKPGKGENAKVDDRFCQIEADLKYYPVIKQVFFWDIPDCKKVKAEHVFEITSLELPKGEKDFEQIRLETKRKGRIIRKLEIDSRQDVKEKEFEA